ncbi:MAG: hypothetical protein JO256_05270 [Alphaproteobacteria bacterium]|nr:hypothetical protein [Alphaproteobacteria bacterium]
MKNHLMLLGGVAAAALTALSLAGPASAQSYNDTYRYQNGYDSRDYGDRYYSQDRLSGREAGLMDSMRQLRSELQSRRYDLRVSFYNSAMRNLQDIENRIAQARYMGGLSNRDYNSTRNLLDRLEYRVRNELRTARRDYNDDRYADGRY